MKNTSFLLFTFILLSSPLLAQLSVGGIPPSFSLNRLQQSIEVEHIELLSPDFEKIRKEDSVEDAIEEIPWRFGVAIPVDLGLDNAGSWMGLPNGDRIWRLIISSPSAISININYDKFYMPKGAKLFLYSNRKKFIGAFTSINNKLDSSFATRPVQGDKLTIEYYEPKKVQGQGKLHIHQVVHGYRGLMDNRKSFGASGWCQINVNCPEAMPWQNEKRAVAMVLVNSNTRKCSGTLINNVRQDSTPYFLSAGHCGIPSNSIFIFNYESELCSPSSDGSLNHSINGSQLKATYFSTDFALYELSVAPPDSFNAFYAGWSAIDEAPLANTVIHHPMGDVKKISFDYDSAITTGYFNSGPLLCWMVKDWDLGSTENASSGSALLDQNHRIVGQLNGGLADCNNQQADWFGKFSDSWEAHTDSTKQLKYWLDPDNTGKLFMNGLDTDTAEYSLDAEMLFVEKLPVYICDTLIQPVAVFRNTGNDTLKNLDIIFRSNNGPFQTISWSGSLSRFEIAKVTLGNIVLPSGVHQLSVATSMPNNLTDHNSSNDTLIKIHQTNNDISYLYLNLKTDDYGDETTWQIKNRSTKEVLEEGGPYAFINGGKLYKDTLCLYDSCFTFSIFDDNNDGFTGIFGNGYYLLKDGRGDTLLFGDNFTGSSQSATFCLDFNTSIKKIKNGNVSFNVIPNPISESLFSIQTDIKVLEMSLMDIHGKKIKSWYSPDMESNFYLNKGITAGIYLLSLKDKSGYLYFKKIIIQ